LTYSIIDIAKEFRKLKEYKIEIDKATEKVYNDIEVGEFYTFKDGNEIVISDKYQEDNKFYFEYKYVNQDAKTIKDLINDEYYTVTVKQFAHLVKHYGRK
jgi:hypothetical protein